MKAVTASLANAIASSEQVIVHEVTCDFDNDGITDIDDLSRKVSSLSKNHALTTDLPAQVRIVPGVASAELSIGLNAGHTTKTAVASLYKSISTNSSGASTSKRITIARPSGALAGDVIICCVFNTSIASPLGIPNYANVEWASLAWRGDFGATGYLIGHALTRRIADDIADEPDVYEFYLDQVGTWVAIAIRIGDPYAMGIHTYTHRGSLSDNLTAVISGISLETTIPNSTLVQVYAAFTDTTTTATWTPSNDNATTRSTPGTSSATNNIATLIRTRDDIPPDTYPASATLSMVTDASLVFQFALAPKQAGNELQHAAWTFSELNELSPYYGKERYGRNVRWRVGYATSEGIQYVNYFTGQSFDTGGSSSRRGAELTSLDNRETMRNTALAVLGALVAEFPSISDEPRLSGLEATFIISKLFAYSKRGNIGSPYESGPANGNGYFASYNITRATNIHIPAHGSVDPFLGFAHTSYSQNLAGQRSRVRFRAGPFVASTEPAPVGGFTKVSCTIDTTDFWNTTNSQSAGRVFFMGRRVTSTSQFAVNIIADTSVVEALVQITSTGVFRLILNNTHPLTRTITGPTVSDTNWHFLGVHWDSTTGNATFRVDGVATNVAFATWSNTAIVDDGFTDVNILSYDGMQWAELQLQRGTVQTYPEIVLASDPWVYDTFTPTAFIDRSILLLDALPLIDETTDIWTVCSEIANAEYAAFYFDDDGYPHYRTGQSDASIVGQTIQKELTARTNIENLAYRQSIRQVANTVGVEYTPFILHSNEVVWTPSGALILPQLSTITIRVVTNGQVLSVGIGTFGDANTNSDGSGPNVAGAYTVNVASQNNSIITITITSFYPSTLWLVDTSGNPSVSVTATWYAPVAENVPPIVMRDTASIRRYRIQPLSITNSVWRQSYEVASSLCTKLTVDLAIPAPVLTDVPIVGDPCLEFGDLTSVQDVNGLGIRGQYRITGIRTDVSEKPSLSQDLTLRSAGTIAQWNESNWGDGTTWGP